MLLLGKAFWEAKNSPTDLHLNKLRVPGRARDDWPGQLPGSQRRNQKELVILTQKENYSLLWGQ